MKPKATKAKRSREFLTEIKDLRGRLADAQELVRAISAGEVDALVVSAPRGEQVYTLQGADQTYRVFFDSINEGAVTIADDLTILYCNKCFSRMVDAPLAQILGRSLQHFLDPLSREPFAAMLRQAGKRPDKGELEFLTARNKKFTVSLSVNLLKLDEEKKYYCLIIGDLTEQKRNEQVLAAGRLTRSVLEQAADAIVVFDRLGTIIRANEATRAYCGSIPLNQSFADAFPLKDPRGRRFTRAALARLGNSQGIEVQLVSSDGVHHVLELSQGSFRVAGEPFHVILFHDITDRKKAELKIREMVSERELLLREVHHRTKNNMEVITGMISLLANSIQQKQTRQALAGIQLRIRVLSLVHEKLYQGDDLAQINMTEYVADLAAMILDGMGTDKRKVKVLLNIARLPFSMDTAIACGMIINELLTNSLKYAFPGKRKGEVGISLQRAARGGIVLSFHDTGIGLAKNFNPLKTRSLGMKLLHRLVINQMQGTIELGRDRGFRALIKFNI